MAGGIVYDVYTDLPPEELNFVGERAFALWVDFALGKTAMDGRRIMHPTGRYASSIEFRRYNTARIAIIADEDIAPEAGILETGHGAIDLLQKLTPGRSYPMHRGTGGAPPQLTSGRGAKRVWASVRAAGFSGFATVPRSRVTAGPRNTSGRGPAWTIPAMPAYSPAKILADLISREASG